MTSIRENYSLERQFNIAIILSAIGFFLMLLLAYISSEKLYNDGYYSQSIEIRKDRKSKSGVYYKYTFATEDDEVHDGTFIVRGYSSIKFNIDSTYFIVYSKNNPELNVLLFDKVCCDSTLLYTKIKEREWSIWDM